MRVLLVSFYIVVFAGAGAFAWELNEEPAKDEEWGRRPGDGAAVETTPPTFSWRPEEAAESYELHVAAAEGFEQTVYSAATPWSAHCPPTPLPAGTYYWRYRAKDKEGQFSSWSASNRFVVPEGAAAFPMPDRATLLSRIPKEHPRLFFRPEDAGRLRELAEGSLAEPWRGVIARAEKLIAEPPDLSEPPKYPEGTQRKGEEWRRIWWGNRVRAIAVADGAASLAFAYRLGGDARYGEAARDLMMALCDWDPKGATNYDYNDEAAMPLLYYPSRAYTWAYDIFSSEQHERIREMMRIRGDDCFNSLARRQHLWRPYSSHHNRAWHWLGEVATTFYDVIPEAPDWLEYAVTVFYTCYPVWGDDDGGWHEGSAYWSSYLGRFLYWAMVSQSIYDIDVFTKPFFRHVGDFGLYVCPPGTQTGAFSDQSVSTTSKSIAQLMGLFAGTAGNPYWQWYAEQHGDPGPEGYFGFLAAVQQRGLQSKAPEDLPSSKVFRGTGLAVMNTNLLKGEENIQVHFKSSPFGRQSHGYNANNAFLLNLRGERALIRSGRRDIYGSPHHQKWMWETKSDNAILVNGVGQYPHTAAARGQITHFYASPSLDVAAGEAGESYANLERWARRIIFFKPYAVLIHDVLEATEPATYQWLLHAEAPFELGEKSVCWSAANGRLDIAFLQPEGLVLSQTNEFDVPPHDWASFKLDEWHLTAATQQPAVSQEFITLIRIDGAAATALLEPHPGGTQVRLLLPETTADVFLGKTLFAVDAGDGAHTFDDAAP